jgi:hypothetical protein
VCHGALTRLCNLSERCRAGELVTANFAEFYEREVPRIPILGTSVNKSQ